MLLRARDRESVGLVGGTGAIFLGWNPAGPGALLSWLKPRTSGLDGPGFG